MSAGARLPEDRYSAVIFMVIMYLTLKYDSFLSPFRFIKIHGKTFL